jgi:hypothetical protein
MLRVLLFVLAGVALGVAGTLGVLAYSDDDASSSTADAPSTAEINRAYQRCMKAITEDNPYFFDDGPTATERVTCRREAMKVAR